MGRTEFPDLRELRREPWLDGHIFNESEMALFSECTPPKLLDAADIVIEAISQRQAAALTLVVRTLLVFWLVLSIAENTAVYLSCNH
jgi:hypothetical protein